MSKKGRAVIISNNAVQETILKWCRAKRLAESDDDVLTAFLFNSMCKTTLVAYPCAVHRDNFPMRSLKDMFEEMEEDKWKNQYSMSFEKDEKVARYKDYNDYIKPLARFAQLENKQLFQLPFPSRAGVRGVGRGGAGTKYVFAIIDWGANKQQRMAHQVSCERRGEEQGTKKISKKKYKQLELNGFITDNDKKKAEQRINEEKKKKREQKKKEKEEKNKYIREVNI